MDSPKSHSFFLLLFSLSFASALDLSIIDYGKQHNQMSGGATDTRLNDEVMAIYESWLTDHGKNYSTLGEKERRFEIFKDNLRFIDEHNAEDRPYKVGLNRFADLTNEEYRAKFTAGVFTDEVQKIQESDRYALRAGEKLPNSVDWREKGAVGPIRNQGKCGSCWAFSAAGTVESINQIVTGKFVTLSPQQLVDCSERNWGCMGGWMPLAYEFIVKDGGLDSEKNYPYRGVQGSCNPNRTHVVSIDGYERVPRGNENAMQKAVANQPISVSIETSGRAFQLYKSGVFDGACGTRRDHTVITVGYGTSNGLDYWIVRNSWGPNWGEKGYIRMRRNLPGNRAGKCGIAVDPQYPVKTTPVKTT